MDDDLFEFEAPPEAAPELILGKKKKKKKKKKDESVATEQAQSTISLKSIAEAVPPETSDKVLPEDRKSNEASDFQSCEVSTSDVRVHNDMEEPMKNVEPSDAAIVAPTPEQVEVKRPMTAAEKKKAKKERERLAREEKAKKEQAELDAIFADLDDSKSANHATNPSENQDPVAPSDAPSMTASQKKRAKKKKKAAAEKNEPSEVDALMADLDPSVANNPVEAVGSQGGGVDDLLAELMGGDDAPAAKKKPKKKKKKGAAKADDEEGDGAAAGPSVESKKPKKKESALVRKMREQRERMLAEEERIRKLKEEEDARIAEEERVRKEQELKKEEEKRKKKAADKAKKDRKRQEGTLLSKGEKERRRKAELFRKQMMDQGLVPAAKEGPSDSAKPGRVVYGRKKRGNRQKTVEDEQKPDDVEGEKEKAGSVHSKSVSVEASCVEPEVVPDAWDELPEPEVKNDANGLSANSADMKSRDIKSEVTITSDNDVSYEDDSEDSDSEYEGMSKAEIAAEKRLEAIRRKRGKAKAEAMSSRSADHLRSPVICILGHVDTGKTKILDRIRRTNVQDGEAGGITQQIGATYFPIDAVKKEATKLVEGRQLEYNVPSLLIIDTPGHESFTNLRSRGSSLCDIAILVVDIMHGLEPQTRESIDLLKLRKTPFIVALNKIDRIYDWDSQPHNCPTRDSIEKQPRHAREEFKRRVEQTKLEFAEIGFNTELYWENNDVRKMVSIVPTSAISGEGIPDLLMLLLALPQKLLTDRLMFNPILEATVLEVKVIEGLGTTIDIILTGGTINEGDTLMVVGLDGPIVTTIRALLTPHPMKEMRVKGQYLHHKEIKAAQGIKISADGLEKAVAGTQVLVVEDANNEDEMEYAREEVMKDFQTILTNVDRSGLGVYVQASTLGSLEALLEFLRTSKIPVSGINIGPVHKRDVTKCSTMLERRKEFATILAFDVTVEREAKELAEEVGVQIFTADIIYHLFDQFTEYMELMKKQRREQVNDDVVFPSICKILPQHVYNKKDPIVVGVDVMEGILRVGTPLVVRHGESWLDVGRVASIELNKKQVVTARKGESVAVKIQHKSTEHIMYGRHFDFQDALVSKMSRSAIDLLKESFRDDLETEDWRLVVKLKKLFDII